jgi:sporulation protein YlmC with PRC-barrel domain
MRRDGAAFRLARRNPSRLRPNSEANPVRRDEMPRHDQYYDEDQDTMSRERDYRDRDRYRARAMFRDDPQAEPARRSSMDGRSRDRQRDPRYGSDAYTRDIAMDETRRLIASNKVEGTPVYDRNGDRFGSIHNFMVDKRSGKVMYAVLEHSSGFLGFDTRFYPLKWDELTYDTRLDGYHVDLDEKSIKRRGSYDKQGRYDRGNDSDRMSGGTHGMSSDDKVAYDYRSDDYRR